MVEFTEDALEGGCLDSAREGVKRGRGERRDAGRRNGGEAGNGMGVALKTLKKEVGQTQVRGGEMRGKGEGRDGRRVNVGRGANGKRVGLKSIKKGFCQTEGKGGEGKGTQ